DDSSGNLVERSEHSAKTGRHISVLVEAERNDVGEDLSFFRLTSADFNVGRQRRELLLASQPSPKDVIQFRSRVAALPKKLHHAGIVQGAEIDLSGGVVRLVEPLEAIDILSSDG